MKESRYVIEDKFDCCVDVMVTVIIKGKAACVMSKSEYNNIIKTERKFKQKNRIRKSA